MLKNNLMYDMDSNVMLNGPAWGPVQLKAESLPGDDSTGHIVLRLTASVFDMKGVRLMSGIESGIAGRFAPRFISDSGSVIDGNIFQTKPNSFLNLTSAPKPMMQLKNMQQANVQFLDPSRKIDDTYIQKMRVMERLTWDEKLLAPAMNAWIRSGFLRKN
jgi:hypothetical protein